MVIEDEVTEAEEDVYTKEELKTALAILLDFIDFNSPAGMHDRGQSPDWFVAAAMMICNVRERERGDVVKCLVDWHDTWKT